MLIRALLAILLSGLPAVACNQSPQDASPRIDGELRNLRDEYVAFVAEGNDPAEFRPSDASIPVRDGLVLIDATAEETAETLLESLESLGLEEGAAYGRVVSGWLPIEAISRLESLDALREVRPAGAQTGAPRMQ